MQRTEGRDRLSPRFHLPHPTATFTWLEHDSEDTFDDAGSNGEPR